jgi:hypothetical protein
MRGTPQMSVFQQPLDRLNRSTTVAHQAIGLGHGDLAVGHLTGTAAAAQLLFYIAVTIKCRNGIKWS